MLVSEGQAVRRMDEGASFPGETAFPDNELEEKGPVWPRGIPLTAARSIVCPRSPSTYHCQCGQYLTP